MARRHPPSKDSGGVQWGFSDGLPKLFLLSGRSGHVHPAPVPSCVTTTNPCRPSAPASLSWETVHAYPLPGDPGRHRCLAARGGACGRCIARGHCASRAVAGSEPECERLSEPGAARCHGDVHRRAHELRRCRRVGRATGAHAAVWLQLRRRLGERLSRRHLDRCHRIPSSPAAR